MQNRTFLVLLRPIFCEKLKIAPHRKTAPPQTYEFPISAEKSVSISVKTFFFFWRSPVFGRKKHLNFQFRLKNQSQKFGEDLFFIFILFWRSPVFSRKKRLNFWAFREISSQISDKPCDTDSRTMNIRVKVKNILAPVRPRVLSGWGITLLEKMRAADES